MIHVPKTGPDADGPLRREAASQAADAVDGKNYTIYWPPLTVSVDPVM